MGLISMMIDLRWSVTRQFKLLEVHPTLRRGGVVRSLYGRRVEEEDGLASARNGKKLEVRFVFPSSFINIRAGKRYPAT